MMRSQSLWQLSPHDGRPIGLDLMAAVGLAEALGYDRRAMAELLPAIDAGAAAARARDSADEVSG